MVKRALKLASWNVNGIRACIGKGFWDWFESTGADMVCLQETKITEADFDKLAAGRGLVPMRGTAQATLPLSGNAFPRRSVHYAIAAAEKPGYSGVVLFASEPPLELELGLGKHEYDREGRTIFAHYADFTLVNVYVPNGGRTLERIPFKIAFCDFLLAKLEKLRRTQKHIIICGDMNVAHTEADIKNPRSNVNNAGFTPVERAWFGKFLGAGYADTFRLLHPDARDVYSWWSYRPGVRARNVGWRIDYFVVTDTAMDRVKSAGVEMEVAGSDHCPVTLGLSID